MEHPVTLAVIMPDSVRIVRLPSRSEENAAGNLAPTPSNVHRMCKNSRHHLMRLCLLLWALQSATGSAHPREPDTLVVRHPCVVFYRYTQAEYDSLIAAAPFRFDSLAGTFAATVRGVEPFLNKHGLDHLESSASTFAFLNGDTSWVRRVPLQDVFGTICYAPGRAPLVMRGVSSESSVLKAVIRFFGLR